MRKSFFFFFFGMWESGHLQQPFPPSCLSRQMSLLLWCIYCKSPSVQELSTLRSVLRIYSCQFGPDGQRRVTRLSSEALVSVCTMQIPQNFANYIHVLRQRSISQFRKPNKNIVSSMLKATPSLSVSVQADGMCMTMQQKCVQWRDRVRMYYVQSEKRKRG